jgi:DNA-binding HxlR family transcriptional regulator
LDEIDHQPCSIARAMAELGDAWSLLVLREAFYGRARFTDFVRRTGAQKTVISDRLKRLVDHGILERVEYQQHPTRHEYPLTDKGRALLPVLLALIKWGDDWASGPAGPPVAFTHTECGHPLDPTLVCGSCGVAIDQGSVIPSPGPGYPEELPDVFANRTRPI